MHAVEYVVRFCYQELEVARASHIEIQERIESEKQRQTLQSSPEVNGATQRIEAQEIEVRDSSSLTTFLPVTDCTCIFQYLLSLLLNVGVHQSKSSEKACLTGSGRLSFIVVVIIS